MEQERFFGKPALVVGAAFAVFILWKIAAE
jgi:hypothetical protein